MASSTAPLAAEILPSWAIDVEAVLTQILLVLLVGVALALGLADRSRFAYGLTLAIGAAAVGWWLAMLVARDPAAFHRLTVLIGSSGLLVVTGLVLDWPAFWQPARHDESEPAPAGRTSDRVWRPPQ